MADARVPAWNGRAPLARRLLESNCFDYSRLRIRILGIFGARGATVCMNFADTYPRSLNAFYAVYGNIKKVPILSCI